jgi:hypothetical protein
MEKRLPETQKLHAEARFLADVVGFSDETEKSNNYKKTRNLANKIKDFTAKVHKIRCSHGNEQSDCRTVES